MKKIFFTAILSSFLILTACDNSSQREAIINDFKKNGFEINKGDDPHILNISYGDMWSSKTDLAFKLNEFVDTSHPLVMPIKVNFLKELKDFNGSYAVTFEYNNKTSEIVVVPSQTMISFLENIQTDNNNHPNIAKMLLDSNKN